MACIAVQTLCLASLVFGLLCHAIGTSFARRPLGILVPTVVVVIVVRRYVYTPRLGQ